MTPTAEDYARALSVVNVTAHQLAMLRTHYAAPLRTLSPEAMSLKLGWPNGASSHLHYGRLARKVREKLNWSTEAAGDEEQLSALVTFGKAGGEVVWVLRPEVAAALEILGWIDLASILYADEKPFADDLFDGLRAARSVETYQKALAARQQCLAAHGTQCAVCAVRLEEVYGTLAAGFIEVHHLQPLSRIGRESALDPKRDLRPVCPNCHRMLHRREPPLSIEELRLLVETRAGGGRKKVG